MRYDLIVIGGGIAGMNAAIAAKEKGCSVLLIEKERLGGIALNGGGRFIKYLFRSMSVLTDMSYLDEYSIKADIKNYEIDFLKLIQNYDLITNDIIKDKHKELIDKNIDLIFGKGEVVDKHTVIVNGKKQVADTIFVAWGAKPVKPNTPGIDQALLNHFVIWSNEIKNLRSLPKSIAIIGGGLAATELTIILSSFGVKVYLIAKSKGLLRAVDLEVTEQYIQRNMNDNMIFMFESEVDKYKASSIVVSTKGEHIEMDVDKVILATGFSTNIEDFKGLEVKTNNSGILVDDYGQTNIDSIFAIGNASHFPKLSNLAIIEGNNAISKLYGISAKMDLPYFVRGIKGNIEVASYGYTEEELIEENRLYEKMYLSHNALKTNRFYKDKEFTKVLFDRFSGKMVGIHLVSKNAINDISLLLLTMEIFNYYEKKHVFISPYLSDLSRIIEISENIFVKHDVSQLKNNFTSFYQPKYNVNTNEIIGCESLTRVLINGVPRTPFELIELYEKNGFISEIDLMSLRNSCMLLDTLKQKGILSDSFRVSTNFSPVTLVNTSTKILMDILSEFDIDPDRIMIEITERSTIDSKALGRILKSLRELGFRISLDDFSTGASGISLLNVLPLDEIKIDMSILPRDDSDVVLKKIYTYSVKMLKHLGYDIICEGVETIYQINFLKENNIRFVQGYYYSKPVDIDSFLKLF